MPPLIKIVIKSQLYENLYFLDPQVLKSSLYDRIEIGVDTVLPDMQASADFPGFYCSKSDIFGDIRNVYMYDLMVKGTTFEG